MFLFNEYGRFEVVDPQIERGATKRVWVILFGAPLCLGLRYQLCIGSCSPGLVAGFQILVQLAVRLFAERLAALDAESGGRV